MTTELEEAQARARSIWQRAAFVRHLDLELSEVGQGWAESAVELQPRHLQQDGIAHAGLIATLGDHTAGAAGCTELPATHGILSIQFSVNLLRPAAGRWLRCRSEVLKAGRTIQVVESTLWMDLAKAKPVAKVTVTLAVIENARLPNAAK